MEKVICPIGLAAKEIPILLNLTLWNEGRLDYSGVRGGEAEGVLRSVADLLALVEVSCRTKVEQLVDIISSLRVCELFSSELLVRQMKGREKKRIKLLLKQFERR
jgi:hypothetical protein